MTAKALKLSIVTEKLILDGVARIIEQSGARGYTVIDSGAKGSQELRTASGRSAFITFAANVKIEVITPDREVAQAVADQVAEAYFENFPGIIYLEEVEVLRAHDF